VVSFDLSFGGGLTKVGRQLLIRVAVFLRRSVSAHIESQVFSHRAAPSYTANLSSAHHRMQLRRFTRLTNAFSKKLENMKAALALHFAHYNFCRIHQTLRVTPAMASGLTDHVWDLAAIISAQ